MRERRAISNQREEGPKKCQSSERGEGPTKPQGEEGPRNLRALREVRALRAVRERRVISNQREEAPKKSQTSERVKAQRNLRERRGLGI